MSSHSCVANSSDYLAMVAERHRILNLADTFLNTTYTRKSTAINYNANAGRNVVTKTNSTGAQSPPYSTELPAATD